MNKLALFSYNFETSTFNVVTLDYDVSKKGRLLVNSEVMNAKFRGLRPRAINQFVYSLDACYSFALIEDLDYYYAEFQRKVLRLERKRSKKPLHRKSKIAKPTKPGFWESFWICLWGPL